MGMEVSLARGLEAGGYYNLAKLLWALAYADEIRRSQIGGYREGGALVRDLAACGRVGAERSLQKPLILWGSAPSPIVQLLWGRGEIAVCRACGHLLLGIVPDRARMWSVA
jgi:hypothetical protein